MSLKAILHYEHQMALYQQASENLITPLTDRFYTNPETVDSNDAKLFVDPIDNTAAKLNRPQAPARILDPVGASEQRGALFTAFNQIQLSDDLLGGLLDPNTDALDNMGAAETRRQSAAFAKKHAILKELVIAKILANGTVYADVAGNVLESASADDETYTFGIAAGHQSRLDWDGSGNIIVDYWSDASADIQAQHIDLDDAARSSNVPVPDLAICNSTVKNYLRDNTDFRTWAAASFTAPDKLLAGDFIEGLFGKNWLFIDGIYTDATGTTRKFIPDKKVIYVPSNVSSWLRPMQGQTFVPTSLSISDSLEGAMGSWKKTAGRFSYSKLEHNPPSLNMFMGDKFGWVLAEPNAIWQATIAA